MSRFAVKCGMAMGLVGILAVSSVYAQKPLKRAATVAFAFGSELATSAAPLAGGAGGVVIASKVITLPTAYTTLYVTISAAADEHAPTAISGVGASLGCQIDGVECTAGGGGAAGSPSGWIAVLNQESDLHDNSVTATWCKGGFTPLTAHTVTARLASNDGTSFVFTERGHVNIEMGNRPCS